jgi:hypothetical protein
MAEQKAAEEFSPVDWEHKRKIGRSKIPGAPGWPQGVHPISIEGMALMGLDEQGMLYWDGKPVEVRRRLDLSKWEKAFAVIVGFFTILGGVGAVAQGWAAAHQWSCQIETVDWHCPPKK